MKTPEFQIGKTTYRFQDITVRTYNTLQAILASEEKDKEFAIVECLTLAPVAKLKTLKYADWLLVWEETILQIQTLNGTTDKIQPIIEFKGAKWGLPNVQDMSVGEFADLEVFFSQKDSGSNMHQAAAILYRPVLKQKGEYILLEPYDAEKARERTEDFLDLPLSAIRSANAFFLQSATSLLRNTAHSLSKSKGMNWMSPEDREQLLSLTQLDLGGESSIASAGKILLNLTKQHSSRLERPTIGLPLKKRSLREKILDYKHKRNTK